MAVVTLLSDFIDGTSMALAEDTDAADLNAFMTLCRWRGVARTPGIPLWPWLIETLIRVLPIEVNAWDRFSIRQRHFIHDPVTQPERFGGSSHAPDLATVLSDSGLPNRGTPRPARKVNAST